MGENRDLLVRCRLDYGHSMHCSSCRKMSSSKLNVKEMSLSTGKAIDRTGERDRKNIGSVFVGIKGTGNAFLSLSMYAVAN